MDNVVWSTKEDSELTDRFEDAICEFNFYKVQIAMEALHWTWAITGGKVPTVKEMEDNVRRLFDGAMEQERKVIVRVSSGGFEVSIEYGRVSIKFVVEHSESLSEEKSVNNDTPLGI